MIVFETLLLGLAFGVRPIRLMVAPQVKSVEVRLDGVTVGVLVGEPWILKCDLGGTPHPHELVAIAREGSGKEIGRAHQWVNMPRPSAEATLMVERRAGSSQVVSVRLAWNELKGAEPVVVRVTLDGRTLAVSDPRRIELPPTDPTQVHLVSAELLFPEGRTARADAAFGGDLGDEAQSELTAVPLEVGAGTKIPSLPALQGWLRDGDAPLRVLGLDEEPFDVVLILDQAVWSRLKSERGVRIGDLASAWKNHEPSLATFETAGPDDDRLFIGVAVPQLVVGNDRSTRAIFPTYEAAAFVTSGFRARLANLDLRLATPGTQMLADAVATGGSLAAAGNRPRAVVLLLAGSTDDASTITPLAARAYLEDMHVPLCVWALDKDVPTGGWGPAEDVSSQTLMFRAATRLKKRLSAQRIVWLEGAHLLQRIRLAEGVPGVRLPP